MTFTTMIIIWAMVIAGTLLLEFFTVDFFACCFSFGAFVALIVTIFEVHVLWQLLAFFVATIVAICVTRPLVKKFFKKPTVPTNLDQNFGKTARLLADVVDGKSSIKINDVVWSVACAAELKKDDTVVIESVDGNKLVVKPVTAATSAEGEEEKSATPKTAKTKSKSKSKTETKAE